MKVHFTKGNAHGESIISVARRLNFRFGHFRLDNESFSENV